MKIKAYAKINLRLKVLGRIDSGYHRLQMVNAKVGIYDEIEIKRSDSTEIELSMNGNIAKEDNLAYKVAHEIFEYYNLPKGVMININKKIPFSAGLAGGSADAAAVIMGINKLFKLNLGKIEMQRIALKYGTDIVYCLEDSKAIVEGIGEKITPIIKKIGYEILIVNPNIPSSTKDVYQDFDSKNIESHENTHDELLHMNIDQLLENDLEPVVMDKIPEVEIIKKELSEYHIRKSMMSGSGSTVFALISKKYANEIYESYQKKHPEYLIYLTKIR